MFCTRLTHARSRDVTGTQRRTSPYFIDELEQARLSFKLEHPVVAKGRIETKWGLEGVVSFRVFRAVSWGFCWSNLQTRVFYNRDRGVFWVANFAWPLIKAYVGIELLALNEEDCFLRAQKALSTQASKIDMVGRRNRDERARRGANQPVIVKKKKK